MLETLLSPTLKSMSYQLPCSIFFRSNITFLSNCSNPFRLAHGHEPNISQPLGANFLLYPLVGCQPGPQISQGALQKRTTLVDFGAWFASSCFEVLGRKKSLQFPWLARTAPSHVQAGGIVHTQRRQDDHVLYISNTVAFEPDGWEDLGSIRHNTSQYCSCQWCQSWLPSSTFSADVKFANRGRLATSCQICRICQLAQSPRSNLAKIHFSTPRAPCTARFRPCSAIVSVAGCNSQKLHTVINQNCAIFCNLYQFLVILK